jgi:hypothetical protein
MGTININGKIYQGNNIVINGSKIIIDGVERRDDAQGVVEVRILEGVVENISSDASISCNNVKGNVQAGGSVSCNDVGGSVMAGGSVSCDDVGGNITAGGSVRRG